jgi:hypothetical protein
MVEGCIPMGCLQNLWVQTEILAVHSAFFMLWVGAGSQKDDFGLKIFLGSHRIFGKW